MSDPAAGREPLEVVGAALVEGGRVLAALRGPEMSLPGRWEFPGGKVQVGETAEEALVREIREELGVEIAVEECLGTGRSAEGGPEVELRVYRARILSGRVVPREHVECLWVGAEELGGLDWAEADRPLLNVVRALLEEQAGASGTR